MQALITFGEKPIKIDKTISNVRVILFDPKTNLFAIKYLVNKDKYKILGGAIKGNNSEIQTAKRELTEETGLTDFKIITQLGPNAITYYQSQEGSQERISTGFLAVLKSEKSVDKKLDEYEISNESTIVWKTKREVLDIFILQSKLEFKYTYHLEFFKRAYEYINNNTI